MSRFRSIDDLGELSGRQVLVRADLNVPMIDGEITDDTRLRAVAPTVQLLLDRGARVLLLSHFGRPKGRRIPELSLQPLTGPLAEILQVEVSFARGCTASEVAEAVALARTPVQLLENTRFHPGEETNDRAFALDMAALGTAFINDAFSVSHRAHASVTGLAEILPAAAGLAMEKELSALEAALTDPAHPVAAVVGGAKVSTKLGLLGNLAEKVDHLIIGGGMANTFLAAKGINVGASLCEHDLADTARDIMARADDAGCRIHLPVDVVVAKEFRANPAHRTCPADEVADDEMILDVGPASVREFIDVLEGCKTLIWNGPLGAFETPPFEAGTTALAKAAGDLTQQGKLLSVAGGGDTVAALAQAGARDAFSHVSTAGGATLEWMEGKVLPGLKALEKSGT
ncbi:MAG: phosphoglycerate kinase [Proteobacteria bacterium]|nr:phosphoglycerate kinase [Pseudomonadota bacterium]